MKRNNQLKYWGMFIFIAFLTGCGIPRVSPKNIDQNVPESYTNSGANDTTNFGQLNWHEFFQDQTLLALIDTALEHNQELKLMLLEIGISNNEISAKKGEYLPQLNVGVDGGVEKVGRYTSQGANDANTEIEPGKEMPEPLPDVTVGLFASWEIDIWHKLRNGKKAAVNRYLASVEGKNFMTTLLVSEIAVNYYELLALDQQYEMLDTYIAIQKNALKTVKIQKQAGEATELAVKKFEAEVLSTQSIQFDVRQKIVEVENRLNFFLGRFPQKVERNKTAFENGIPDIIHSGIPSQLLANRPDIRKAEYRLMAAKLDVKIAKAQFYPSLDLTAGVGLQAFNPAYFVQTPESMLYGLAGELTAPLLNRKKIKADYLNANNRQVQAVVSYEQTVLNAFIEVVNQLNAIDNLKNSTTLKSQEVEALSQSIGIASELFKSARADYMEVLLTQRDALDARFELIENKLNQYVSYVKLYQALGGGWK
jgi:NodT family efflux transporter outer membrane factor (OMF) lipoprotein